MKGNAMQIVCGRNIATREQVENSRFEPSWLQCFLIQLLDYKPREEFRADTFLIRFRVIGSSSVTLIREGSIQLAQKKGERYDILYNAAVPWCDILESRDAHEAFQHFKQRLNL